MKDSLSLMQINDLIEYEKLHSFVRLVASGPRPDGTYNYCRDALQRRAENVLADIKKVRNETIESMG
jgi:hypothetical protein